MPCGLNVFGVDRVENRRRVYQTLRVRATAVNVNTSRSAVGFIGILAIEWLLEFSLLPSADIDTYADDTRYDETSATTKDGKHGHRPDCITTAHAQKHEITPRSESCGRCPAEVTL